MQEHEHEAAEPPASPTQQMSDRDVDKLILVTPSRARRPGAEHPPSDGVAAVANGLVPADHQDHPARHLFTAEVKERGVSIMLESAQKQITQDAPASLT